MRVYVFRQSTDEDSFLADRRSFISISSSPINIFVSNSASTKIVSNFLISGRSIVVSENCRFLVVFHAVSFGLSEVSCLVSIERDERGREQRFVDRIVHERLSKVVAG